MTDTEKRKKRNKRRDLRQRIARVPLKTEQKSDRCWNPKKLERKRKALIRKYQAMRGQP